MLLAMLPARLPVPKALPARLEAWLNLSQREKARVFIIVRTRAMTGRRVSTAHVVVFVVNRKSSTILGFQGPETLSVVLDKAIVERGGPRSLGLTY